MVREVWEGPRVTWRRLGGDLKSNMGWEWQTSDKKGNRSLGQAETPPDFMEGRVCTGNQAVTSGVREMERMTNWRELWEGVHVTAPLSAKPTIISHEEGDGDGTERQQN